MARGPRVRVREHGGSPRDSAGSDPIDPITLRELQAAFWRSLSADGGRGDTAAFDPAAVAAIEPSARLAPAERLAVYTTMYFWRIQEVLRDDFARTAAVLGPAAFEGVVRDYVARHSSEHPSIRWVGRALPARLAEAPPPDAPPWVAELARLEWARLDLFDAEDAAPIGVEALRQVPPEEWGRLRFAPIPALATFASDWPIDEIWAAVGDGMVDRTWARERVVLRLWRQDFRVWHARLAPSEETAFARFMAGRTFAAICEVLDGPEAAAALLVRWLQDGLVARAA
jgi:hypothetical protein